MSGVEKPKELVNMLGETLCSDSGLIRESLVGVSYLCRRMTMLAVGLTCVRCMTGLVELRAVSKWQT